MNRNVIRQLLSWPNENRRPDLGVVLVDCDEKPGRHQNLVEWTKDLSIPVVVALPVQEFESWLIADHAAVARLFGPTAQKPSDVESLHCREAKDCLARWIEGSDHAADGANARLSLARMADLKALARLPSFAAFVRDLKTKVPR